MKLLKRIFSIINEDTHKKIELFGFKLKFRRTRFYYFNRFVNENILANYIENLKTNICKRIMTHKLHYSNFKLYKNIYKDKVIVIVATGPTLKYYTPIKNAIHIGVNKSFKTNINLDYLFIQDYIATKEYIEDANNYNCKKFYGKFLNKDIDKYIGIPDYIVKSANAKRYYNDYPNKSIYYNIMKNPLMDFSSVVFPAIHFALFTGAQKIYLVGCDCSNNGYYDSSKQLTALSFDSVKFGYEKLKRFINKYYKNTEIISINPVGLKGMFKDIFINV